MSNGSSNGSAPYHPSPTPQSCAEIVTYLSAFADGELASPLREQVAAHLAACESCNAQLARYAEIDAALATLPRTRPSTEVYERIAAAVGGRAGEPALRESLGDRRPIHLRRRVELPEWAEEPVTPLPISTGSSRVPRWVAAALPTVAAILLVTLTAYAIHGLGARVPPVITTPISSPAVPGDALQQTHAAIQGAVKGKALKFTPVELTYVPGAPTYQAVSAHVVADPSGNGVLYLDITWTLSGSVTQIHLREGPKDSGWYGYTPAKTAGLTWQVGTYQWMPMTTADGSNSLAVGEQRDTGWLAMDATVSPAGGQDATTSALIMLRLMSLSMDAQYQALPVTRIIPVPSNVIYHFKGNLIGSSGSMEAYSNPAQSATRVEVRTTDGTHYIDIANAQQGIRLDLVTQTYQQLASGNLTPAVLDQTGAVLFTTADTLARHGGLWYVGQAQNNGAAAYDFVLVDAPSPTHVYVDEHSQQVVAVTVDLASSVHPGGSAAPSRFSNSGCALYTLVEIMPPSASVSFSTSPPSGYTRGNVPASVACANGSGQTISQMASQ